MRSYRIAKKRYDTIMPIPDCRCNKRKMKVETKNLSRCDSDEFIKMSVYWTPLFVGDLSTFSFISWEFQLIRYTQVRFRQALSGRKQNGEKAKWRNLEAKLRKNCGAIKIHKKLNIEKFPDLMIQIALFLHFTRIGWSLQIRTSGV